MKDKHNQPVFGIKSSSNDFIVGEGHSTLTYDKKPMTPPQEPMFYNVVININTNTRIKVYENDTVAGSSIGPESTKPQCHITVTQTEGKPTIYVSMDYIPSEIIAVIDHCNNEHDDSMYPFRMGRMINLMEIDKLTCVSFLNQKFEFDENCNYKLNFETFDIKEFQEALVNRLKRFKEIAKEIEAYKIKEYDVDIKDIFNEN